MIPCHIFVGVESVEHEVARNHCLLGKKSTHTDPVIKPLYKIYVMFPKFFFAKKVSRKNYTNKPPKKIKAHPALYLSRKFKDLKRGGFHSSRRLNELHPREGRIEELPRFQKGIQIICSGDENYNVGNRSNMIPKYSSARKEKN